MDFFVADVCANTLIWLLAILIVFTGMLLYGIRQAWPVQIEDCAIALFLLVVMGSGFGLLNGSIARYFPFWLTLISYSTRGLVFFSGVFHLVDFYSIGLRNWLIWNPILHGVDWFRLGVYGRFPTMVLDQDYLIKCALIFLVIGMVADRATLRAGAR
jgi:capsular polysaccharide transport system permease protein